MRGFVESGLFEGGQAAVFVFGFAVGIVYSVDFVLQVFHAFFQAVDDLPLLGDHLAQHVNLLFLMCQCFFNCI